MPAVLSDTNICDRYVPAFWRSTLEELARFQQLRGEPKAGEGDASPELFASHSRLLELSAALLEPRALEELSHRETERLFARAVLLTLRLKQCVVADDPIIGAGHSRMLALYEADFYGDAGPVAAVRQRLAAATALAEGDFSALDRDIDQDQCDARRRQALVRALRAEFQLQPGAENLAQRSHALWRACFPEAPIEADEIALIVTSTLVFFCLPLAKNGWAGRPRDAAPQQRALDEFIRRLAKFQQGRFGNFPAFGCMDAGRIDAELVGRLAAASGLAPEVARSELPRLVTIIPHAELEKYVVHDVWGHSWQASMLRFEEMYDELAHYAEPMAAGESAPAIGDSPRAGQGMEGAARQEIEPAAARLRWMDAFDVAPGAAALDEGRFRSFVSAELAERLTVAMGPVLAEQMADVAEFKLIAERPELEREFPTSSWLPAFPSKLDLTLQDLPFYFSQATKVFRLWADQDARQEQTVAQLVARGADQGAARAAVRAAVLAWRAMAEDEFAPRLSFSPAPDARLRVNVFTRLALNFLGLHRSLVDVYRRLGEERPRALPLNSYRDLLVIAASVFFESNRSANLWRVDEYVALRFLPLCRRLDQCEVQNARLPG